MNEFQGCERICTTSYDLSAPQIWPEGAGNRRKRHNEECVPATHAVCPTFHDPTCGEDGRTYQNECVIAAHCVRELHKGDCVQGQKHDLQARVLYAPGALPLFPSCAHL